MTKPLSYEQIWGEPRPAPAALLAPEMVDADKGRAGEEKYEMLRRQQKEVWPHGVDKTPKLYVTCPCGRRVDIRAAYKCRYCLLYLCQACADRHFGGGRTMKVLEEAILGKGTGS